MRARIELLLKQQKLTNKDVKDILQVYVFGLLILPTVRSEERRVGKEC